MRRLHDVNKLEEVLTRRAKNPSRSGDSKGGR
jgi:hypothetical protein